MLLVDLYENNYIVSGYKLWISRNKRQIWKGKPYLTRLEVCQNL